MVCESDFNCSSLTCVTFIKNVCDVYAGEAKTKPN